MTLSSLKYVLCLFACLPALLTGAQSTYMTGEADSANYFVKQLNGLNALLSPQPGASNLVITYYVKVGTVYENDSLSGISYIVQNILGDKIRGHLSDSRNKVSDRNTTFQALTTTELTIFRLTTVPENYVACLQLLRDSLNLATIHEVELQYTIEKVKKEIAGASKDYLALYNTRLIHKLYRRDANLQLVKGDSSKFKYIDLDRVRAFCSKYYIPNNAIIAASGKLDQSVFQREISNVFKELIKGEFDPQLITKIVDFKPMVYNTRFIVSAPVQIPEIRIHWLFPGARSNVQSSYYGVLLATMLNDPNNFIQAKARKMGCQKFLAEYEASNFSGVLSVTLQPDKKNFFATYNFVLAELQRLEKTLLNTSSINAGKLLFKKQFETIRASRSYPEGVVKYWVYNDESYFPTLSDSVFTRRNDKLRHFIIEYMNQSPHVTGLMISEADRQALKVDSFFVELNDSINDYIFTYRKNIPDLEGPENWGKMNALVQWLKENPDLTIQVNGFADKGEYNRFRDDSITQFIDSIPSFERVRREIFKTGTYRLEMLRALKIVKYLYDQGIGIERLKGTSMTFSSKTREEQRDNMKCNLTIEKIKKAPSLYEYHYGKPKPVEPENRN